MDRIHCLHQSCFRYGWYNDAQRSFRHILVAQHPSLSCRNRVEYDVQIDFLGGCKHVFLSVITQKSDCHIVYCSLLFRFRKTWCYYNNPTSVSISSLVRFSVTAIRSLSSSTFIPGRIPCCIALLKNLSRSSTCTRNSLKKGLS